MANEFVHDVTIRGAATKLTQAEHDSIVNHKFNNQVTGDILYASSATQLSRLADVAVGSVLISGGVGVAPSWSATPILTGGVTLNDNAVLGFGTANGESTIKSDGSDTIWEMVSGGLTIGLAASAPSPDQNNLHIWKGTAGVVTALADSLLILESSGAAFINILAAAGGNASGFVLGQGTDSKVAWLVYSETAGDTWDIGYANALRLQLAANLMEFQEATTISTTTGALTLAPAGGSLLFTGTLALTGSRVTQSYHTNITSTNAVTVDSWGKSKEQILRYGGDALAVLRDTEVISFRHKLDRDSSGRMKLGVRAESVREPLALVDMDYGHGLGVGPALDTMGLTALNTRAIQQIEEIIERLGRENHELRALVERTN